MNIFFRNEGNEVNEGERLEAEDAGRHENRWHYSGVCKNEVSMKRIIALSLTLALCMSGCAGAGADAPEPSPSAPAAPDSTAGPEPAPGPESQIPTAAEYIESCLAEFDRVLYVYKDFGDGANYYTQKAWMGDSYSGVPEMREDAEGRGGTTGIAAGIDLTQHAWGGYMFINGILKSGATVPELDFGTTDAGLDLTGAEKLTFWARGEEGGERVEFFMSGLGRNGFNAAPYADTSGQLSTGYVTLTDEWEQFEIPLSGAGLSRVGCGFGWVTNDSNNGAQSVKFYLDDIRYEFAEPRLRPMFLTSYAPAPAGTDDAVINNFAYTYDQSIAIMALSYAGKHERARQIADALVYAVEHDRYFDDGRLRNAYMGGNPQSYPGWYSARGQEFARMPGFYDTEAKEYLEDAYAVGTSAGNCAWAVLALLEACANAPERTEYLNAAKRIADFVLTLESGNGFAGGYEGWEPSQSQTKATYKSVEHNADLIASFGRLAAVTGEEKYADASESAKAFVLSMYDSEKGCFYTGTAGDGVTANKDVIPLDCQTWTLCVLGEAFKDKDKVLRFVEEHMATDGGYGFAADSQTGVWNEGAAQMGVLYQLVGDEQKAEEIRAYLNANRLPDGSLTAADRDGLSTGFMVSGTDILWEIDRRQHLGATAWLSFLQQDGRNPLAY
jgi:hypothetical protein